MKGAAQRFGWMLAIVLAVSAGLASADDTSSKKTGALTAKGKGNAMISVQQGSITLSGKGDLWVSKSAKVEIDGTSGTKSSNTLREFMDSKRPEGMPPGPGGPGMPGGPRGPGGPGGPGGPPPQGPGNAAGQPDPKGYLYEGVSGKITIKGEEFIANFDGSVTKLEAKGIGIAMLRGEGSYVVTKDGEEGKTEGKWSAAPNRPGPGGGPGGPRDRDRGEGQPQWERGSRPPMPFIKFGDAKDMQMPGMPGRGPRPPD
jgi:hypothetical protein